ncbi:MAG: hypothetical protein MUF54_06515 [Polyangiaceae bacterium]|jgi:hypothetical protein|nr:hypothetical protein [Polyangiaceae bacterium]
MIRTHWKQFAVLGSSAALLSVASLLGCGSETEVVGSGGAGTLPDGGAGTLPDGGFGADGSLVNPDGTSGGDSTLDPDGACAWSTKEPERAGVDIVFIIDNSHSMGDEIIKVRDNINAFANTIANSGLDYRVVMLSAKGTNLTDKRENVPNLKGSGLEGDVPLEVCVPPPLGVGPGGADPCGHNPERFYHLDHWPFGIQSHNGMWLAIGTYQKNYTWVNGSGAEVGPPGGGWQQWSRPAATKFFVMITDDDAEYPTAEQVRPPYSLPAGVDEPYEVFDWLVLNDTTRFGPPGAFGTESHRKYVYNTICGWTYPGGASTEPSQGGGCRTAYTDPEFNAATSPGEQHQKLAKLTGGVVDSICKSDWSSVLGNLANTVVATLGCEYMIPASGDREIDPDQVIVQYTPQGGGGKQLTRVTDKSKCGQYADAWYYDNNTAPTAVLFCPDACDTIGKSATGKVDLLWGCAAPPPK